ncbi:MAG: transcription antitermination factor NusB [Deltaproteobacteria bacterium]|nr:transcription antitermination factor NusB [Deltaproteobacteria bacterium]
MGSRRQAREHALQALYQCEALGELTQECVDWYFQAFHADEDGSVDFGKHEFARILALGVLENLDTIDKTISAASQNWSVSRMSQVDRNILRLGAFEISFLEDIPPNVSINEAIEIAKRFASDDSPMFINGVLDKVATDARRRNVDVAWNKAINE